MLVPTVCSGSPGSVVSAAASSTAAVEVSERRLGSVTEPMKFSSDIRRLLGLGGGDEEIQVQSGDPDPTDSRKNQLSSQRVGQGLLKDDEALDDEERARRKAEKRRAKKKRQKERKKLEREERLESLSEQDEERAAGVASESDSEEELKEEAQWIAVRPRNKSSPKSVSALMTADTRRNCQVPHKSAEDEPEWDVSSAFVANAASHIKVKGQKTRAMQTSPENEENACGSSQVGNTVEMRRRGESLTVQGIEMFKQGQYDQAVDMFTEAISCDPSDHRFFGNRSCCYSFLEQFSSALTDAQRSIQLAPEWPTGYFRKGCALMGLKRYGEAGKAMEQVLKLNEHCKEASSKLFTCQIQQLMEVGFEEEQSKKLLEKFTTVQAVVASPQVKALQSSLQDLRGCCRSLWIGNITFEVTEKDLWDLFKMFGEIESVRVLHERFCAFVNFKNANVAAEALEKLQGVELRGSKLVMRYPDRWIQRTLPPIQRTNARLSSSAAGTQQPFPATGSRCRVPMRGDECLFWRTTGCSFGHRCRFKHASDHQGRDKNPGQP